MLGTIFAWEKACTDGSQISQISSAASNNHMGPKNKESKGQPAKAVASLPKRKKEGASPFSKKSNLPTLTVHSFAEPLGLEAYIYEQKEGADGYLRGVEEVLSGQMTCDYFSNALFHRVVNRRIAKSPNNEILKFSDPQKSKLWRKIILRYPEGGTSHVTRQEGLKIAKKFLMDNMFTKYPPNDIVTIDATDAENVPSLDQFFVDNDIKKILQQEISPNMLDCNFHANCTEFAAKCWSGATEFDYAISLGFPNF